MQLLDGREAAKGVYQILKEAYLPYRARECRAPRLAVVLAGNNPASEVYVKHKRQKAQALGWEATLHRLDLNAAPEDLKRCLSDLAQKDAVDGIIVQFPLPPSLHKEAFWSYLPAHKDIDGFHPDNVYALYSNQLALLPATPYGILLLLDYYKITVRGRHIVVVGRSAIVGKPLVQLLSSATDYGNATVTHCHSQTKDLGHYTRMGDIVIVAAGVSGLLKADMVKAGAIVIDVGIHRTERGLIGDGDFEGLKDKVAAITPVPGGVGPMTIAALMKNTWTAYLAHQKND